MISKAIATNGLPLKIQAEWTDDDYYNRKDPETDQMVCVNVAGWLVRINGKKYPRPTDLDGDEDWSYRYADPKTGKGRQSAIKKALAEARLTIW